MMNETTWATRIMRTLAGIAGGIGLLALAACGGGGTGGSVLTDPGVPLLIVTPGSASVGINVPVMFTITGGVSPYTVTSNQPAIIPNNISVNAAGQFTVQATSNPAVDTTVVLTIRDNRNNSTTASVAVRSLALAVSPTTASTIYGVPVYYQISGGAAPYTVVSSFPTIVASPVVDANGRFTAQALFNPPADVDMALTIRDAFGTVVTTQLKINRLPLTVSPTGASVPANTPVTYTITGGTPPYTVVSSLPSLVANPTPDAQGRFTVRATSAPAAATTVVLTIRDSASNGTTATLTVTSPNLTVLPSVATAYYNTPITLTVSGGSPPYEAFSSNSVVLPIARTVVTDSIVVAPANVAVDTPVTVTVNDSAGATATALIAVRPSPLLNTFTITPTPASPGVGCGTAVCSGQTASAEVVVRNVSGGGIQGRAVKFEVVQGDYQFFTNAAGLPETFANSLTVTSGQDGRAIVRLKANVNAPTQVALIRATELATGNVLNGSFVIAQFTDGAGTLTAVPTKWTIVGPDSTHCSANTTVIYYIFGGTPPYRIQSTVPSPSLLIEPALVQTNGGGFTVTTNGDCYDPAALTITDATGRTITVTLSNLLGEGVSALTRYDFNVVPADAFTVNLPPQEDRNTPPASSVQVVNRVRLDCNESLTEFIQGGGTQLSDGSVIEPTFTVAVVGTNQPAVQVTLAGRLITVTRPNNTFVASPQIVDPIPRLTATGVTEAPVPNVSVVSVLYSDGKTNKYFHVKVRSACPVGP